MACRVGMSTNPQERIDYWKRAEGHTWGQILASGLTYAEAQNREAQEARNRGCYQAPGGAYVAGPVWSVYHVSGGIVR